MASWPIDTRPAISGVQKARTKPKLTSHWSYPLPSEGAISSAYLHNSNGRFHWTTIANDDGPRLRSSGSGVMVFPPTRAYQNKPPPRSILHQAEASANFLRKAYPDIDVPAELIRDELTQDSRVLQDKRKFDPAEGNALQTVFYDNGPRKRVSFLAFPMGPSRCQLNVSAFSYPKQSTPILKPTAQPAWSFDTPIQQIAASRSPGVNVFAVRTMGSTSLFSMQENPSVDNITNAKIDQVAEILASDVGGHALADVQMSTVSPGSLALALDEKGSLYKLGVEQGSKTVLPLYKNPENLVSDQADSFWRLAVHDQYSHFYIISSRVVRQFDPRTQAFMSDLWTASRGSFITCAEMPKPGYLARAVTTKEVLWLDERYPGRPLLGIQHGREFDRTLDICTAMLSSNPLSFLTSRRTGLVSIYDVSRGPDDLIHVNVPPYCLQPSTPMESLPLTGHAIFQHPSMKNSQLDIFHLSSKGSVYKLNAKLTEDIDDINRPHGEQRHSVWDGDMEVLHTGSKTLDTDLGPLTIRDHSDVNLAPAYNHCFIPEEVEVEDRDAVYNLLDRIPRFWQEHDLPVDHILTTFDIAIRSGEDPAQESRADFLTPSAINSKRGFRALKQGRLEAETISKQAIWSLNLAPIIQPFVPDIIGNTQAVVDRLKTYNTTPDGDRTSESSVREADACEQLAMDLALSTDVYSGKGFSKPSDNLEDAMETMSLAASVLSLDSTEPPPVHFSFLSPFLKQIANHYPDDDNSHAGDNPPEELMSLGVRLLVNEWTVGTDPKEYVYEDPYRDEKQTKPTPLLQSRRSQTTLAATQSQIQSQRPPPVKVTPMAPPAVIPSQGVRRPAVQTQNFVMGFSQGDNGDDLGSSQPHMIISTQIVPGPFGGRSAPVKKKAVKKRVGGF